MNRDIYIVSKESEQIDSISRGLTSYGYNNEAFDALKGLVNGVKSIFKGASDLTVGTGMATKAAGSAIVNNTIDAIPGLASVGKRLGETLIPAGIKGDNPLITNGKDMSFIGTGLKLLGTKSSVAADELDKTKGVADSLKKGMLDAKSRLGDEKNTYLTNHNNEMTKKRNHEVSEYALRERNINDELNNAKKNGNSAKVAELENELTKTKEAHNTKLKEIDDLDNKGKADIESDYNSGINTINDKYNKEMKKNTSYARKMHFAKHKGKYLLAGTAAAMGTGVYINRKHHQRYNRSYNEYI